MLSDVPQTMGERTEQRVEGDMMEEEMERLSGLGIDRVSSFGSRLTAPGSSLFQCVSLGDSEPLVLQAEGDVVIGGLFPLHYLAHKPQHRYRSKPQHTPCSG